MEYRIRTEVLDTRRAKYGAQVVAAEKGELTPALVFRDPYMLDFLELADTYSEKDLESAILRGAQEGGYE